MDSLDLYDAYGFHAETSTELGWFLGWPEKSPACIMTVNDFVHSLPEIDTFFGFHLPNIGIVKSRRHFTSGNSIIHVIDERCTIFAGFRNPDSNVIIIYDGDTVIGVMDKWMNIYESFTSLPPNLADSIIAARMCMRPICRLEMIVSTAFTDVGRFGLCRNGMIVMHHSASGRNEKIDIRKIDMSMLESAPKKSIFSDLRMFTMMPIRLNAAL